MNVLINRRLLENQKLWMEINQQTTIFLDLLTEVSNSYSHQKLSLSFPNSKGCKITKGTQLSGCPYQVLDIVRDFDDLNGFNIRILNWWGHGLFLLVIVGKNNKSMLTNFLANNPDEFEISSHNDPWDYEKILLGQANDKKLTEYSPNNNRWQIFKKINLPGYSSKLQEVLSKEIDRIIEYTW